MSEQNGQINGTVREFENSEMPPKTLDERERDACGVGFIANLNKQRSNDILKAGIQALECNDHRGGCNFDGKTGDGSGIMTQIPWELLQKWADKESLGKIDPEKSVVGVFFLSPDQREAAQREIEKFVDGSKMELVGWRAVPVDMDVLGKLARDNAPEIYQLVLKSENLTA